MGFDLKLYQTRCLEELERFFVRAGAVGAARAFEEQTGRGYRPAPEAGEMPYICLRVPTGGGKTFLAAHAVGVALHSYLQAERGVVLWLAPTNAIVEQTLKALRARQHPYRQALEAASGGQLEILGLEDALYLTPATLDGATAVIVATLASLRIKDTLGRRVYAANGALQAHFTGRAPERLAGLERLEGEPVCSLANVLRLRRPLVIMDEAHNARTPLSFETLNRLRPAAVLEFTATPDQEKNPSNVLVSVSAAELKAEAMIKLPIKLEARPDWRETVAAALARRQQLEEIARAEEAATGEYLRPILLFQAQSQSQNEERVTVDALRSYLTGECGIPEAEVAVGTGEKWELPDDLLTRACPVRYVLTVQALREGWDCPFAYVLCTVSNQVSRTAVEQIMGRVLRLPGAREKQHAELNHAYAFAASPRFRDTAMSLADGLVENGFEPFEARRAITQAELPMGAAPLWDEPVEEVFAAAPALEALPAALRERIQVVAESGGGQRVIYRGPALSTEEEAHLIAAARADDDHDAARRLALKSAGRPAWPAALGKEFQVPCLVFRCGQQCELFEDQFKEGPWRLSDCAAVLSPEEFSLPGGRTDVASVDVDRAGRIGVNFATELRSELGLQDHFAPQTASELATWLDRSFPHPQIAAAESGLFLRRLLDYLAQERGLGLPALAAARFELSKAAAAKIAAYRDQANSDSYQQMLFADEPRVETSPQVCFAYPLDNYPAPQFYSGRLRFDKFFYDRPGEMNGEEAECAAALDALPEVAFWVRNLERQPDFAFWLQTPTDKFYPDFVANLRDGRTLAVEYKGADRLDSADTREKRMLGELWAARSQGQCLFLLTGRAGMESALRRAVSSGDAASA